jgi:uncharacterized protein
MDSGRTGICALGSMAEFRINISNLSEGVHDYSLGAETSKIGLDGRFGPEIRIAVRLEKSSRQIFLRTGIHTNAVFVCDRCLENFRRQIDTAYAIVYVNGGRSMAGAGKEEEVHVLPSDANYIDLDEDIRQYVLLAVPPKLLCTEECRGLCPLCGINKNRETCSCTAADIDPRWDALKKLSHN